MEDNTLLAMKQLCEKCSEGVGRYCSYIDKDGICRFPLVKERKPEFNRHGECEDGTFTGFPNWNIRN